jgi:hypothetical protein
MGTLLTDFRFKKNQARQKLEEKVWKDNKLGNPTKRGGHELHTSEVHGPNGSSVVIVQLWKKIDEKKVVIRANIETEEVTAKESTDDVADLLK